MKNAKPKKNPPPTLPHSWGLHDWPAGVWPGADRARYVLRAHRTELIRYGALTRIGRELVVLGAGYAQFLAAQTERVESYQIPPNMGREAAAA